MINQMMDCGDHAWIPLLVPDMPSPQQLIPYLERMHEAKHYSNFGPLVCELEKEFAHKFSLPVEKVTTVSSGTSGIELVLQALNLPPRSKILIPSFTFVATATAVLRAGHIPVLSDVDENSWMLTPDIARAACQQVRIDAVVAVATFGMPQDMLAWQDFEDESGLPVVIDAAAGYGSQWLDNGVQGTLVFSLHTTKSLPAGEGGVVVSTRKDLASKVRQLSNFGINLRSDAGVPIGTLESIGCNAKMSEYHAAVALYSMQRWEQQAHERRALQIDLKHKIDASAGKQTLTWQKPSVAGEVMAPTLLCFLSPTAEIREKLEQVCFYEKIMTRRWYLPLLEKMPVLRQQCHILKAPNAEDISNKLLGVPFFIGMNHGQRDRMISVFRNFFSNIY